MRTSCIVVGILAFVPAAAAQSRVENRGVVLDRTPSHNFFEMGEEVTFTLTNRSGGTLTRITGAHAYELGRGTPTGRFAYPPQPLLGGAATLQNGGSLRWTFNRLPKAGSGASNYGSSPESGGEAGSLFPPGKYRFSLSYQRADGVTLAPGLFFTVVPRGVKAYVPNESRQWWEGYSSECVVVGLNSESRRYRPGETVALYTFNKTSQKAAVAYKVVRREDRSYGGGHPNFNDVTFETAYPGQRVFAGSRSWMGQNTGAPGRYWLHVKIVFPKESGYRPIYKLFQFVVR